MSAAAKGETAQAGAIAIRRKASGVETLIVSAKRNPHHWIFPKGHIEPGETAGEAAVRELREEAGVVGRAVREVGVSHFMLGDEPVEVRYFLVEYEKAVPATDDFRRIEWLPLPAARERLTFDDAKQHLDAVAQYASRGGSR